MNPGHVKGVHDVIEVALFWLMRFAIREPHFLSKYSPQKSNGLLVLMNLLFVIICSHPFTTPDHNMLVVVSSSRGSLINANVVSVTFGFDPRSLPSIIKLHFHQTICIT